MDIAGTIIVLSVSLLLELIENQKDRLVAQEKWVLPIKDVGNSSVVLINAGARMLASNCVSSCSVLKYSVE